MLASVYNYKTYLPLLFKICFLVFMEFDTDYICYFTIYR